VALTACSREAAEGAAALLEEKLGEDFWGRRHERGELTVWVAPSRWVEAALLLRDEAGFSRFSDLTAVDYLDRDPRFDVVLHLLCPERREALRLKTLIAEEPGQCPSLTGVWPAANWYEREVYDLFGLVFTGHPDLRRILLPPDYQGHPLRKDYPVTGPPTSVYR
jgi:NADH-quinone oxidoreductase subunit C